MRRRTILVTGCSSGLGRQTALHFYAQGWNVIASMRSPEKETELLSSERMHLCRLDVTDALSVGDAVSEGLGRFGSIDVLVNNAGYAESGVFEQWDEGEINSIFETNLFGLMRVTKEVLPVMRRQCDGVVINISSIAGLFGVPLSSVYCSTKFAVEGLTQSLAIEYAPLNIKVKVVAPGAYKTNLVWRQHKVLLENGDEQIKSYAASLSSKMDDNFKQMLQCGGEPDLQEVANAIYKCATEETPVHNVVGKDAEAMMQAKNSLSEDELMRDISSRYVPGGHFHHYS